MEYRLRGARQELERTGQLVYLGLPELIAQAEGSPAARIPAHRLQWKGDGPGQPWRPASASSLGEGRIRYIADGEVRFSARVQILPAGTEIRFYPGQSPRRGFIQLAGVRAGDVANVYLQDAPGIDLDLARSAPADDLLMELLAAEGPPTSVELVIEWSGARRVVLHLPFPAAGSAFRSSDGRRLPFGARVSTSELSAIRAAAMVPRGGREFTVEGRYTGEDALEIGAHRQWLRLPMREAAAGLFELDLGTAQRWIDARLRASSDPDGHVRLEIHSNGVAHLERAALDVGRFAGSLR
jgi:hypothetical protein